MPEPAFPVITLTEEFAYLAAARRRRAERLRGGWVNVTARIQAEQVARECPQLFAQPTK